MLCYVFDTKPKYVVFLLSEVISFEAVHSFCQGYVMEFDCITDRSNT